jgi:hypothetical protein
MKNNNEKKPGTPQYTSIEFDMMADQILRVVPAQLRLYPEYAKMLKAKYDSLVAAGFTEIQALEIVKARPILEA